MTARRYPPPPPPSATVVGICKTLSITCTQVINITCGKVKTVMTCASAAAAATLIQQRRRCFYILLFLLPLLLLVPRLLYIAGPADNDDDEEWRECENTIVINICTTFFDVTIIKSSSAHSSFIITPGDDGHTLFYMFCGGVKISFVVRFATVATGRWRKRWITLK